jgi:hypothetical protein
MPSRAKTFHTMIAHHPEPVQRTASRDHRASDGSLARRVFASPRSTALALLSHDAPSFGEDLASRPSSATDAAKYRGDFRSDDGAENFAVIRLVLSTARKQSWNMSEL